MRLRHPKVAELCNLYAAAPEGDEYLLLVDPRATAGIVSCDQQQG